MTTYVRILFPKIHGYDLQNRQTTMMQYTNRHFKKEFSLHRVDVPASRATFKNSIPSFVSLSPLYLME